MKSQRPSYTTEKSERLEARLSASQKELIQHAADLAGRSLTDFVLSASQEAAKKIIRENEVITLTAQESRKFVDALLNPSEPNTDLQKAAKRYNEFFEQDD
ncbi:MAG: DUF1778 domain-containing protein [Coxiellaceae bacterium]|nr:DUF1778 domain-containing protein [Coxiellaceae bacterium]